MLSMDLLHQRFDNVLFVRTGGRVNPLVAILHFITLVDQQGNVATVVDHKLRAQKPALAVGEVQ